VLLRGARLRACSKRQRQRERPNWSLAALRASRFAIDVATGCFAFRNYLKIFEYFNILSEKNVEASGFGEIGVHVG
jgi:hypothetical protein